MRELKIIVCFWFSCYCRWHSQLCSIDARIEILLVNYDLLKCLLGSVWKSELSTSNTFDASHSYTLTHAQIYVSYSLAHTHKYRVYMAILIIWNNCVWIRKRISTSDSKANLIFATEYHWKWYSPKLELTDLRLRKLEQYLESRMRYNRLIRRYNPLSNFQTLKTNSFVLFKSQALPLDNQFEAFSLDGVPVHKPEIFGYL